MTRSHGAGLVAAQQFAAAAANEPEIEVLGLVVVADAPGRLPKVLETTLRLIEGGYPKVWRAAWCEDWRRGEPVTPGGIPASYRALLSDLMAHTGMGVASEPTVVDTDGNDGTYGTDRTDNKETA